MVTHLSKKIIIYGILMAIASMYFSCQNDREPASHVAYLKKYKAFIGNPENKPLDNYYIPKKIIKLNPKIEKTAVLNYKEYPVIQSEITGMPQTVAFHELEHVFKDGSMFFSDERAVDRDPTPIERGDKVTTSFFVTDSKLKMATSPKGDMAFTISFNKIMVGGKLYDFYFDKLDLRYNYYINNKVEALNNSNTFPKPFDNPYLLGPILTDRAIGYTVYDWHDLNKKVHHDKVVISYKWKDKQIEKIIILPFSEGYKPFHTFHLDLRSLDSKNRIYFRLKADFRYKYQGMKDGNILIYDMANDTLYSIIFPYIDEQNEADTLLDTHYVLGDDGLIYCQLVTDRAYYIFKIDPQWNNPGEVIDYDPVFFKFYPELRAEWDKS